MKLQNLSAWLASKRVRRKVRLIRMKLPTIRKQCESKKSVKCRHSFPDGS
eukprot:CAMPEP_0185726924 /NCGR_PEP_ID=MMETSP1171-20130828/2760_1 /TAXON_ID=374046 /ORGANISM="Helicotheca tamensis, Strain CCMP826" /LENGTH=49 /DNA_ID=CAMNT_0028395373 /DNA_START=323 /DNA_END=475 /DNA_ORIENTATION=+